MAEGAREASAAVAAEDAPNASAQLPDRQSWSAEGYGRHARFVSELADVIVAWLSPRPGERILDLGCGDGVLTARLAAQGAQMVGVDTSADMLAAARERGLDVRAMDARELAFEGEFDAVFSNAVLHWVPEAGRVAEGVFRALRPGGRFVAEFGGHGNVAAIVTAMRAAARIFGGDEALASPWFYPTPAAYAAILEAAGFVVRRTALVPRPTPLPTGLEGWIATFRKPFFDQFPEERRGEVIAEVTRLLEPALRDETGAWHADYVRLRVHAERPA